MGGLPSWLRWIIVFAVGLSPILTVWAGRALGSYLRLKLRQHAGRRRRGGRVSGEGQRDGGKTTPDPRSPLPPALGNLS